MISIILIAINYYFTPGALKSTTWICIQCVCVCIVTFKIVKCILPFHYQSENQLFFCLQNCRDCSTKWLSPWQNIHYLLYVLQNESIAEESTEITKDSNAVFLGLWACRTPSLQLLYKIAWAFKICTRYSLMCSSSVVRFYLIKHFHMNGNVKLQV